MAEVLFWQANGYMDSINTALFIAAQLKGSGVDVAVLFDEAAVAALAENKFELSAALAKHGQAIQDNLKKMGMAVDVMEYVKQCKAAGVPMGACGGWCDFLGVRGKLPPEIEVKEIPEVIKLVAESKRIIGGP